MKRNQHPACRSEGSFTPRLSYSVDLDAWLVDYNEQHSHQGRWCFGKTPMQAFIDALPVAKEKSLPQAA